MIKKILQSVREYKKSSILTTLFVSFEVVLEVIIPILTGVLVNIIDIKNNTSSLETTDNITRFFLNLFGGATNSSMIKIIIILGLCVCLLAMISLYCGFMSGKHCAIASSGYAKNLRRDVFVKIQDFSFTNIDKFSSASLLTRLTTDIMHTRMAYQMVIRTAVRSPLMLGFALISSIFISPKLAWIFLIIVPILGFGLFFIAIKAHPLFEKAFYEYDDLTNVVQENVRAIKEVKTYVRKDHENKKFRKVSKTIYDDFMKANVIVSANSPLMQFSVYSCLILIAYIGAKFIVLKTGGVGNTPLTTGNLTALITYASMILNSLVMLSFVFINVIIAKPSVERICEVLNEKSTITNPENPILDIANGDIEFKNVNFSYTSKEDKLVLQNVNLKINSGEVIGIIGGTGSSKSTLVQLIPRLYDVYQGEVTVGGINVKNYDLTTLRNNVAFVLQKNLLFAGSIKENLRWGKLDATDEEIINACKLSQADEFINNLPNKYDTFIEQGGSNVSGGQKQRLCIARALLKSPKILILDDSTSAVDTKTDAKIRKAFKEFIPNVTKIIIAQRIASVQDADKIIVMDNGNIVDVDTHENLLKNNTIYQEVYYSQTKINTEKEEK